MSSRDRDHIDDEDDYRDDYPRRRRQSSNPTLVVAVVVGGLLLAVVVCGGMFALLLFRGADAPMQPVQIADEGPPRDAAVNELPGMKEGMKRVYTRDEFKQLVMAKTEQEVIEAVGKPNVADETPDSKLWIYRNRTTDPATGKTDPQATVRLEGGKVVAVDF